MSRRAQRLVLVALLFAALPASATAKQGGGFGTTGRPGFSLERIGLGP